jgi:hypothetical protein
MKKTISTKLTIVSKGITSDSIAIDYEKVSTLKTPVVESASVDVSSNAPVNIFSTEIDQEKTFVYIKNIGIPGQNFFTVKFNNLTVAKLDIDDYIYLPIVGGIAVSLTCTTLTATAEYGYFSAI